MKIATMANAPLILIMVAIAAFLNCQSSPHSKQEPDQPIEPSTTSKEEGKKVILFFGNSLTAGYGLEESQSFPALIQNRIDSLNLAYKVVNAGISGETTAGGFARIEWTLSQPVNIFVLELGANDALRGFDLASTIENLQNIINMVKAKDGAIRIVLAGMKAPPNMGNEYARSFENIYHQLSRDNDLPLITFLLEGVAGNPELNQEDGIHPNVEGAKIVAENVWEVLYPLL